MKIMTLWACLFLIFSSGVNAECSGKDCRGITIERLYLNPSSNRINFSTSGDETELDCNANNEQYIFMSLDSVSSKEAYSLLLAAHMSQSTFWVKVTAADTVCEVVYLVSDN